MNSWLLIANNCQSKQRSSCSSRRLLSTTLRSFKTSVGCKQIQSSYSIVLILTKLSRLSPNQIQKLLNQYLVADYEQPINGEIMKAVASRVTEKSDVLLLTAVDMDDSGPYEIAEPRVITALETYTPSCECTTAY
jgi:myosin heavy subunit